MLKRIRSWMYGGKHGSAVVLPDAVASHHSHFSWRLSMKSHKIAPVQPSESKNNPGDAVEVGSTHLYSEKANKGSETTSWKSTEHLNSRKQFSRKPYSHMPRSATMDSEDASFRRSLKSQFSPYAQHFLSLLPDAACFVDKHGYILSSNCAFKTLLASLPPECCASHNLLSILHRDTVLPFIEQLVDMAEATSSIPISATTVSSLKYEWTLSYDTTSDSVLVVARPTPHEEEQSLPKMFLQSLSHEMRSPLQTVMCGLYAIQGELGTHAPPEVSSLLDAMKTSCSSAIDVLSTADILEQLQESRFIVGMARRRNDVRSLIHDTVELLRPQANYSNVSLTFETALGASGVPLALFADVDEAKVKQVFRFLLNNAIVYTATGGRVSVSCRIIQGLPMRQVSVSITDEGPGIQEAKRSRIFEEVTPLAPNEALRQESGFGYFIAKRILDQHEGSISVAANPEGRGSVFTVTLPLLDVVERMFPSISCMSLSGLVEERPLRLLVVDDVVLCRRMVIKNLEHLVHECVQASNGLEAVELVATYAARGEHFDAILMDCSMPVMCGTTATQILRRRGFSAPIFGVTGNSAPTELQSFLEHGADKVFVKPLKSSDLRDIMKGNLRP